MNGAHTLVVGGGLSGLALALRLQRAGRSVRVLEGSARAGGQIHTLREQGAIVELGAEGFVARSRAVPALCRLLGIERSLVEQLTTDTYALEAGGWVLLPPGEAARRLGFQVPEQELGRGIRSLAGGMGELTDSLCAALGPRLALSAPVAAIRGAAPELELELADGGRERCGALVIATPAPEAARLLAASGEPVNGVLSEAPSQSNVSVNLLYRRPALADCPPGSGLLFPDHFGHLGLRALSLVHNKFEGRAPSELGLLRVFFRPTAAMLAWDDARFAREAAEAVKALLGVAQGPEATWVSRWLHALPVFSAAYRAGVALADEALQRRGIHLVGSAFHGAGIDAAVASAEAVAARLLA